jgi:glycosyltransferase involved in cell wall biosynthesis
MRVCLDCTPLLGPSAGIKTYLWHLNLNLRRIAGTRQILSYPFRQRSVDHMRGLNHAGSTSGPVATTAYTALARFFNIGSSPLASLLGARVDVFHASNLTRNPPRNACLTATFFDATCRRMPEMHTATTLAHDRSFFEQILKRAVGVAAISETSRRDAIEVLGLRPERVVTIYPGVADSYYQGLTPAVEGKRMAILAKYKLRQRYILSVGTIEPRKNIDRLLDSYEQLPRSLRDEFQLVLAGMEGWADQQTLARIKRPSRNIRYLGYVPEEDLPALTAGAEVLVYPSLLEGFGLPVVQAMASGVPVVTSEGGALREVAGDAALFVDPLSVGEITEALRKILTSPSLHCELSALGRTRAARFRWTECATRMWDFFEKAAGGSN